MPVPSTSPKTHYQATESSIPSLRKTPSMAAGSDRFLVTSRVWLKVSDLKWKPGMVDSVQGNEVVVRTEDGQIVKVSRGSDIISQRTPPSMVLVDDLTQLPDLDEPNMLNSLCTRYMQPQPKIYTRTGPILVGMNPWQDLAIYTPEVLHSYRRKSFDKMPPHIYSVSESAFANLQTTRKNQTILVSGDSGSGKTESTKFMMQYLAAVANKEHGSHGNIEQRVLQCNPVLEAFGNAKTLRNDNSSRFGKYIDIHFDRSFAICGAKIDTYLLERSRVVSQQRGERNFHIFYQLCSQAGVDRELSRRLVLLPAKDFAYIRDGEAVPVSYRAATSFQHTVDAFAAIGISGQERDDIFSVIAAVLHLGNIPVQQDKDGYAVLDKNGPAAKTCARMLSCPHLELVNALMLRRIQAGELGSGDSYEVKQTRQQVMDSRDALARSLYERMFSKLVAFINTSFGRPGDARSTVSILDIFGFEHFQKNYFEQLCINFANEKLQGHFNEFNFSLEVKEYERERIQWSYNDFTFESNDKCIDLIEAKRTGILALLDEQCIMPNGSDATFCMKLGSEIQSHPHFHMVKMNTAQFTVKHYAAHVTYDAQGFCFKNKDPVLPAIVELMATRTSPYVRSLFEPEALTAVSGASLVTPTRGRSTIIFESVTMKFKKQLIDLMGRINAAQPHFVRCINPNPDKVPGVLAPEMILDQLRCSGLMEAVRVSRAGFPVRIHHEDFISRYSLLTARLSSGIQSQGIESKTFINNMLQMLGAQDTDFRIGLTKVFFRRSLHDRLEEDRSSLLVRDAKNIQRVCRGHLARNYVRLLRRLRVDAAVILQRASRMATARRSYARLVQQAREAIREAERQRVAAEQAEKDRIRQQEEASQQVLLKQRSPQSNGMAATTSPPFQVRGLAPAILKPAAPEIVGKTALEQQQQQQKAIEETRRAHELKLQLQQQQMLKQQESMKQQAAEDIRKAISLYESKVCALLQSIKAAKQPEQIRQELASLSSFSSAAQDFSQVTEACKTLLEEKLQLTLQTNSMNLKDLKASSETFVRVNELESAVREKNVEIKRLSDQLVELRVQAQDPVRLRQEMEDNHQMQLSSKLRMLDALSRQSQSAQRQIAQMEEQNQKLQTQVQSLKGLLAQTADTKDVGIPADEVRSLLRDDVSQMQQKEQMIELSQQLSAEKERYEKLEKEMSMEMASRVASANDLLRKKDIKLEELSLRLHMLTEAAMKHSSGACW